MNPPRIPRVLIVDDHLEMAEMVAGGLSTRGFNAFAVASGKAAQAHLEQGDVDALVTDLRMDGLDGMRLLALSKQLDPTRPVIVMTAYGAVDTAVESIRQGAYHYLTKPFKLEELEIFLRRSMDQRSLQKEAAVLRKTLKDRFSITGMVGQGKAMREVHSLVERVAPSDVPVLILGETGTGKGLVARAIHGQSPRASAPFVAVNCAALPESLLESELFGHVKGAFTGATSDRPGLFSEAHGGTLLLDEVGELPLSLQAKLLHVLESGSIRPVGASRDRLVDVRVLAATHRDLREMTRQRVFREDLLYRLDVVTLEIPPLRQRREDLPELVEHFLGVSREKHPSSPVERLSPAAMAVLMEHHWPGNVRELAHLIQRLVVLGVSQEVGPGDLPPTIRTEGKLPWTFFEEILPIRDLQRRYASWALEQLGSKTRAADRLGIDLKTLSKWLSEPGYEPGSGE